MGKFEKWGEWKNRFFVIKKHDGKWYFFKFFKQRVRFAKKEYEDEYGVWAEYEVETELITQN